MSDVFRTQTGLSDQDTVWAGTFWGVLIVPLRASGAQLRLDTYSNSNFTVLRQTKCISTIKHRTKKFGDEDVCISSNGKGFLCQRNVHGMAKLLGEQPLEESWRGWQTEIAWSAELVKVDAELFILFKAIIDAVDVSVTLRNDQGRGAGGRSRGGCWARLSVEKNLALDNVWRKALDPFLFFLHHRKQS